MLLFRIAVVILNPKQALNGWLLSLFSVYLLPFLVSCIDVLPIHYCLLMKEVLKNNRIQRRVYELLSKAVTSGRSHPSSGQRELHFVFFRQPTWFFDSGTGHVAGVHFEKTVLRGTLSEWFLWIGARIGSFTCTCWILLSCSCNTLCCDQTSLT